MAHYSPASVVSTLLLYGAGGIMCFRLKLTRGAERFLQRTSRIPNGTPTLNNLTLNNTMDELTLFPADSLVNHLVLPGSDAAKKTTALSGMKCFELLQKSNRLGLSQKMLAEYLLLNTGWYSRTCALTWKAQDTPYKRTLFRLVPRAHRTAATEFGLLHTPTTTGNQLAPSMASRSKYLLPTPTAHQQNTQYQQGGTNLQAYMNKMLPTPKARDGKGVTQRSIHAPMDAMPNLIAKEYGNNGRLNPRFVEWMMGYPTGWTELKD